MAKLIKASSSSVFLILIIVILAGVSWKVNAALPADDEGGPSPPISEAAKKICYPLPYYYYMCYRFLANVSGVPDKSALPALPAAGLAVETEKESENIERELKAMPHKYSSEADCMKSCQGEIEYNGTKAKELAAAPKPDLAGLLAFLNGSTSTRGGACESDTWDICCHNKCRPNEHCQQINQPDVMMAIPAACALVGLTLNSTYTTPR